MGFEGKVAVVTGAGGGIGEAYAKALAARGCAVVIAEIQAENGQRVAKEIEAAGGRAIAVATDVASEESTREMGRAAAEAFGGIDFLINNAAIYGGMEMHGLTTVPLDYWNRFMAVNMTGVLLATRGVLPHMEGRGGGAIINQSSTAAWMGAGYYGIAKLAIHGITHSLARELGPKNIRVNAIAPGPTDTEATRTTVPKPVLEQIVQSLCLKRMGTVDDMVGAALFLLSDEARWITGHILNVDGGQILRP